MLCRKNLDNSICLDSIFRSCMPIFHEEFEVSYVPETNNKINRKKPKGKCCLLGFFYFPSERHLFTVTTPLFLSWPTIHDLRNFVDEKTQLRVTDPRKTV